MLLDWYSDCATGRTLKTVCANALDIVCIDELDIVELATFVYQYTILELEYRDQTLPCRKTDVTGLSQGHLF